MARLKVKSEKSVPGKLGGNLTVDVEGSSLVFSVTGEAIPKRQIKYLARRYLNQHELQNYLRVVSDNKSAYKVKFWTSSGE